MKWQTELMLQVTWWTKKIAHQPAPEQARERAGDGPGEDPPRGDRDREAEADQQREGCG